LHITFSKEVKVAIVFIVATAVLIWGIMYLKGLEFFTHRQVVYAVYNRVNGLVRSNPVTINGLKIGQVKDIYFQKNEKGRIIVELYIANDYPIPSNSTAQIVSSDLMGSKEVEIDLGDSKKFIKEGDTLNAMTAATFGEEVNQQLLPIKHKAEDLISSIDTLVTTVQEVLNKNTRDDLVEAIGHVRESLKNLAHMTYNMDTLIDKERSHLSGIINNVSSISANLRQNNDKITNILNNFSAFSDSLARTNVPATFNRVNKAIEDLTLVIDKINKGQGSLGLLLNNDSLYREVNKAARDLNLLLEDIRLNPKKYVKVSVF
jgi:phospholipid/cholesterol/gamma-HCH transport system substrate-binding protein